MNPRCESHNRLTISERKEVTSMRHLNLELEKLEQRIAPGVVVPPSGGSTSKSKGSKGTKATKATKDTKDSKSH